ncbi:NUMOD4 [uncultured Caudovirales phage]|uniref:NUMOD4 n=1 Tax=uncultured Caudovirales phage TaxID=2100421 RepID=A0A6J5M200_9CAUD|nr:NUMOD4 [uncultured Caudovirales phage]
MQEIWKPIKNYEGIYEISNYGEIKVLANNGSGKRKHDAIMKTFNNGNGYVYITLTKNKVRKNYYIHRLLAEHFIPNADNRPHVNHINGIKNDNRLENLEWCTLSENMRHAKELGLICRPNSKLDLTEVIEIRLKHINGQTRTELMSQYKISRAQIHRIVRYQNWKP